MAKVTGIGGVFFKSADVDAMRAFFGGPLGVATEPWGAVFPWREREDPTKKGATVLGLFQGDSGYFPGSFMVNLRVDDLDGVVAQATAAGFEVVRPISQEPNGRFAHLRGPEGLVFELWEPVDPDPYDP